MPDSRSIEQRLTDYLRETAKGGITGKQNVVADRDRLFEAAIAIDLLIDALLKIANGDGYYGAQAREYKQIAKGALSRIGYGHP